MKAHFLFDKMNTDTEHPRGCFFLFGTLNAVIIDIININYDNRRF